MNPQLQAIIQYLSQQSPEMQQAQQNPEAFAKNLKQTPQITPDFLNQLMSSLPMGAGMIAPTANKTLLGVFDLLRQQAPKLMQKVEETGRTIFPYLTEQMPKPNTWGIYRNLNPLAGQAEMWGNLAKSDLPSTTAHELKHFLTDPSLALKKPGPALETAQQLEKMMPLRQSHALNRYTQKATNVPTASDDASLRAYNESLSYLTEALLKPAGENIVEGADPMLEAIANALGHGIR